MDTLYILLGIIMILVAIALIIVELSFESTGYSIFASISVVLGILLISGISKTPKEQ